MFIKLSFRNLLCFILTFSAGLIANTVSSQSYIDVDAYYLNLEKDTIKGYIKAEDNYRLAQSISFKISETEKEYQIIKPIDCLGFSYDTNRSFVSYIDSLNSDTIFMELLNVGPMNLYAYYQQNKTIYYLLKQGETRYYRLEKEEDKIIVKDDRDPGKEFSYENKEYVYEDKKYLGVLNLMMQDCEKIKNKISHTKWDKQALIKLVDSYNNCIDPSTEHKSNLRKMNINIGAELGALLHANPSFDTYLNKYETREYKGAYGISLATYAKFWVLQNFSVDLGLGYSYTNLHIYNINQNMFHYEDIHFKFHHLDIPLNLQYNLTKTKLSPFIFVHAAYSFVLSHEMEIESNSEELSGTYEIEKLDPAKSEWGGGIGAIYDKTYFLKLEYTNTNYQRGASKLMNNQVFTVKIGYLF